MCTPRSRILFILLVLVVSAGCESVDLQAGEITEPSAALSPSEVVSAQLRALSESGEGEDGIETAYRFASPSNRENTGPLENFRTLFDNPVYEPMVGHREAEVFSPTVQGDLAIVPVSLTDDEGSVVDYVFVLTRQQEEPYENMWMTDAVQIHSPENPDTEMVPDSQSPSV